MEMKKLFVFVLMFCFLLPVLAFAADSQVEGKLKSLYTVMTGKELDKKDPRKELINNFVIVTADKKNVFLPGVPPSSLRKYLNEEVRAYGELQPQYDSIKASRVEVKKGDKWRTIWTSQMP